MLSISELKMGSAVCEIERVRELAEMSWGQKAGNLFLWPLGLQAAQFWKQTGFYSVNTPARQHFWFGPYQLKLATLVSLKTLALGSEHITDMLCAYPLISS